MRITKKRDNREYTYNDFGRPEYYEEMVDNMCARLKINRSVVCQKCLVKIHHAFSMILIQTTQTLIVNSNYIAFLAIFYH